LIIDCEACEEGQQVVHQDVLWNHWNEELQGPVNNVSKQWCVL
jgi:hypothetical protein